MRLLSPKALLIGTAFTIGCHESTAPPSSVAGYYLLQSVNNRGLPADIQAGDGDTITVFWSTVSLDGAGKAVLTEHLRFVHPNTPASEGDFTTRYVYHVTGDDLIGHTLAFDYSPPCPANALCVEPPVGMVTGSSLTLSYGTSAYRPPSFYRRAGLD